MLKRVSGLYWGLFLLMQGAILAALLAATLGWAGLVAVLVAAPVLLYGFLEYRLCRPLRALGDEIRLISGEAVEGDTRVSRELRPIVSAVHAMGQELMARNRELGHQKEEFRRLFDLVPCSITVQDREFRLVEYNSEFRKAFAPEEGDFCYHAYKGRTSPCPNCPVEKTFQDGKAHSSYEKGVNKDGTPSYWLVKTFPIHDDKGEVTAAMEVGNDITRIVQAEEQMIHAGKMATLGTMATGVAHELNQPLTVLKSSIGVLKRRRKNGAPVDSEVLDELLPEMDSYVDRASQIINDMREFGRKDEATLESVDVPCVVEKAARMFKEQFRIREVALRVESASDLPPIMAEPHRLEQVVVNLLVNARDSVCKRWEDGSRDEKKHVSLDMRRQGRRVALVISDNGVGMDETTRKRIFDPFFTTKGPGEGTGIGLSISDNIVRNYGGTIHVWSEPGKGSRFTLSFPAAP